MYSLCLPFCCTTPSGRHQHSLMRHACMPVFCTPRCKSKLEALGQTGDSAYLRQGTSYQCRDTEPYPVPWTGSPAKFNHLFIDSLPIFPENFMQIRSEVFCLKLLTNRQIDKQTNKQRRLHILLGGGNQSPISRMFAVVRPDRGRPVSPSLSIRHCYHFSSATCPDWFCCPDCMFCCTSYAETTGAVVESESCVVFFRRYVTLLCVINLTKRRWNVPESCKLVQAFSKM